MALVGLLLVVNTEALSLNTAVSDSGVGVGLRTTIDWINFDHKGMIFSSA